MHDTSRFSPHSSLASDILTKMPELTDDGSHDFSHIERVWQNVQRITQTEGGDLRILTAATLLHDCVDVPKSSPLRSSASKLAADHASRSLADLGWTKDDIDRTAHAIETHSFSANITPTTLEARILQDADRLDAIGHIGIARCFYVSGRLGRALYDPSDPEAKHRDLDDSTFALDHFHTKLLRLSEGFETQTGQRLASERHKSLQGFVGGLLAEISPL